MEEKLKKRTCAIFILNILLILFVLFIAFLVKLFLVGFTPNVVIIGAMDSEVNSLIMASKCRQKEVNQFKTAKGKIGKNKVIIARSGTGKVNSAIITQYLIDKYHPKLIINTGIAGATDKNLKIGDVIIASDLIQYDVDLTFFGYPRGFVPNVSHDKRRFFEPHKKISHVFQEEVSNKYLDIKVIQGRIATGDKFVSDYNTKISINKIFNAQAVDMESASIAQTAQVNKIPYVVIRTISDLAYDVRKEGKFNNYEDSETHISKASADILVYVLKNVDLKKYFDK